MFMSENFLLCGSLAIATAMEVDEKATADLFGNNNNIEGEESAIGPANEAFSYLP